MPSSSNVLSKATRRHRSPTSARSSRRTPATSRLSRHQTSVRNRSRTATRPDRIRERILFWDSRGCETSSARRSSDIDEGRVVGVEGAGVVASNWTGSECGRRRVCGVEACGCWGRWARGPVGEPDHLGTVGAFELAAAQALEAGCGHSCRACRCGWG